MTNSSTTRVVACAAADLAPGEMRRVCPPDMEPLAVYNIDGSFYATADTCTHARASLTEGDLEGDEIVCPVHFGTFHVPSGRPLCLPVEQPLATYPVVVEDGDVLIEVRS